MLKTDNITIDDLDYLTGILLGPNGCPWDKKQTHESMCGALTEECNEVIHAIHNQDMANLCEELGDVLWQIVFHAKLAEMSNQFSLEDVIAQIYHKLISRHTHVFGSDVANTEEEALAIWHKNKQHERENKQHS